MRMAAAPSRRVDASECPTSSHILASNDEWRASHFRRSQARSRRADEAQAPRSRWQASFRQIGATRPLVNWAALRHPHFRRAALDVEAVATALCRVGRAPGHLKRTKFAIELSAGGRRMRHLPEQDCRRKFSHGKKVRVTDGEQHQLAASAIRQVSAALSVAIARVSGGGDRGGSSRCLCTPLDLLADDACCRGEVGDLSRSSSPAPRLRRARGLRAQQPAESREERA